MRLFRHFPQFFIIFMACCIAVYAALVFFTQTKKVELSEGLYLKPVRFFSREIALVDINDLQVMGPHLERVFVHGGSIYGLQRLNSDSIFATYFIYTRDLGYVRYYQGEQEFQEMLLKEGLPPFDPETALDYQALLKKSAN